MDDGGHDGLESAFEEHRPLLRSIAFRMLGSEADADDALQDVWVRTHRAGTTGVHNPAAWFTTVTARVCLNRLRTVDGRREEPVVRVPEPVISDESGVDPEQAALLGESLGLALLVVLESLTPAERLAFVLHDMFGVPFEPIAALVDRSPTATRQLASRARRRVHGEAPAPDPDPARQRESVDAFLTASRDGDFEALVAVLDTQVLLRSDGGVARPQLNLLVRGSEQVARQALLTGRLAPHVRRVLVNGTPGVVVAPHGRTQAVMAFTVAGGRIVTIDVLADPARLARLDPPRAGAEPDDPRSHP
ncbi:sigma-70 family RNA polymerase sigma factor [Nocardioides sp.]|uniref:sigma-70 family RNA polymerase sigma factor n=1 Tax=Nocardioides sp. TaxID=35761 RepID=UPI002EDB6A0E